MKEQNNQGEYIVRGTITNHKQQVLPNLLVRAFDEDPTTPLDLLGTVVSDVNGRYEIKYSRAQFETPKETKGADLIIKIFSPEGKELYRSRRFDNSEDVAEINIEGLKYPDKEIIPDKFYIIRGKVVNERGEALPNSIVEVFDKASPGSSKVLVSICTPVMSKANGDYEIKIPYENIHATGKLNPDLVLKVSDHKNNPIHQVTKFNSKANEEINLIASTKNYKGISELSSLSNAIDKYVGQGTSIKDIKEDESERGITYLSQKTKWDARLVAMNVLASKMSSESTRKIPKEFFYSLFRSGVSSKKFNIYRLAADNAIGIYKEAVKANVIDNINISEKKLKNFFVTESVNYLLESKELGAVDSMDDMLKMTLEELSDRKKFVALYYHGAKDKSEVWKDVEKEFGRERTMQLQLEGKLGFLTFNNATLINKLKSKKAFSSDPLDLVQNGYYKNDNEEWDSLVDVEQVPEIFKGKTQAEKKGNYINWMTTQLELSYPTAITAEMVRNQEIVIGSKKAVREEVYNALYQNKNGFELGSYSINKHIEDLTNNGIKISGEAIVEMKRLHRVNQLAPSRNDMNIMLQNNLDTAFKITRYDKPQFIKRFASQFGNDLMKVQAIHDKASTDAALVTNMAMSYMTQIVNPLPAAIASPPTDGSAASVKKYPTLEGLFGSLDYCSCGHCESVLSPAAYYVDLLQFLDLEADDILFDGENPLSKLLERRPDLEHIELTCENTNTVLPYIDLVNEILEYWVIHPDLPDPTPKTEKTIAGFEGFNIGDTISSSELLANPQYINNQAYQKLKAEVYPFTLPFDRDLELSRAYFNELDLPLYKSMEIFRKDDAYQNVDPEYGWKEIFIEQLNLSPTEYKILADSNAYSIHQLYGITTGASLNNELSNAKILCQKLDVSYAELVEILKSEFINPNAWLLPRLEILQTVFNIGKAADSNIESTYGDKSLFEVIDDFVNNAGNTNADFNNIFPQTEYDGTLFGNDLKAWLTANHSAIMSIIMLAPTDLLARLSILENAFEVGKSTNATIRTEYGDETIDSLIAKFVNNVDASIDTNFANIFPPAAYNQADFGNNLKNWLRENYNALSVLTPGNACDFGNLQLKYAHPTNSNLSDIEYWKFLRLIRFMKKMKWSLIQTDRTIKSLTNLSTELTSAIPANKLVMLDAGFEDLIVKLALMMRIKTTLKVKGKGSQDKLLALWGDIGTQGKNSLFKRLFLNASVLPLNDSDNPFLQKADGSFLTDNTKLILNYKTPLLSAFNLTEDEWELIVDYLGYDAVTQLDLNNVSMIFKYGFLSKSLKISVEELLDLVAISGLQPFQAFTYKDAINPLLYKEPVLIQLINVAKTIKSSGFKIQDIKYLFQHIDETGKGSPTQDETLGLMKILYQGLKSIEEEYPTDGDVTEEKGIALLTAIYGTEAADTIFPIFNQSRKFSFDYDHWQQTLEEAIGNISSSLAYDDLSKKLSFSGKMNITTRDGLLTIAGPDPIVTQNFHDAISDLFNQGELEYQAFFNKYPEFQTYHNTNSTFDEVIGTSLMPLVAQLKRNFIIQTLSDLLDVDSKLIENCIDKLLNDQIHYVLHSKDDVQKPILADFVNLSSNGVTASYFNGNDFSGVVIDENVTIPNINYDGTIVSLPENTIDVNQNISARWSCLVEISATSNYNFYLDAASTAEVNLKINGESIVVNFDVSKQIWENQNPLSFEAGQFYTIEIEAKRIKNKAFFKWQQRETLIEDIPNQQLYPKSNVDNFASSYLKTIKALKLIEDSHLVSEEVEYFSNNADFLYDAGTIGFLNKIPVSTSITLNESTGLFDRFLELLKYMAIKDSLQVHDGSLAKFLAAPNTLNEAGDSVIYDFVNWKKTDVVTLMNLLTGSGNENTLEDRNILWKVTKAMDVISRTNISAGSLITWSTSYTTAELNSEIQAIVRSKYSENKWLDIVTPINDGLRDKQRDALVAYVINCMRQNYETRHIDSVNKLFEYFLIDVEMDPCMKTSRIKQAISTVQLFVYRCLMNLENKSTADLGVKPESINAKQWEWMKRYRVWEANRKVFLYPENWLEPSLRDTKSPLFKDFEGELLQSDINDELAVSALLNYLEKLDQIAQLKICGICKGEGNEYHVVGRTHGANRHFYHRVYDGTWSAWEKINLDVEEEPVIPVFWKGRLFIFWTTIIQKGKEDGQVEGIGEEEFTSFDSVERVIEVSLCWSEYYNGKWQVKRTSDLNDPVSFVDKKDFNPNKLKIYSYPEKDQLRITVQYDIEGINYVDENYGSFVFYNKHGAPEKGDNLSFAGLYALWTNMSGNSDRSIYNKEATGLTIDYKAGIHAPEPLGSNKLLKQTFKNINDVSHPFSKIFEEPFLCGDHKHQFFVTISKHRKYSILDVGYGIIDVSIDDHLLDQIYIDPLIPQEELPTEVLPPEIIPGYGAIDPAPILTVRPERILVNSSEFEFEGALINVNGIANL